jgi:glycosyl transferase family 25
MAEENIHAVVISLTRAKERRQTAETQLSSSVSWEFIDAIDGRKMQFDPIEYNRKRAQRLMGWTLSDGEIGCFLSHREAWRKCLLKNQIILVLEDDFRIKLDLLRAIDFAIENISIWDILRLQGLFEHGNKQTIKQNGEFDIVQNDKNPFGSAAYLIKPETAKILLKFSERFYEPVDDYLENYEMHGLRVHAIKPYPIDITNLASTIDDRLPQKPHVTGFKQINRSFFRIINRIATGQRKP